MKKALSLFPLVCVLTVVGMGYFVVTAKKDALERLYLPSPSGGFLVFALRFKGQLPHPLDYKMRLFLQGKDLAVLDKHQTSLPVTRETRLEWVTEANPYHFLVKDERGTLMRWRVEGNKMVCEEGQDFLAPDPYAAQPER